MTTEHNRRVTDGLANEITKRGFIIERQEKEINELRSEVASLKEALHETRMQYISDFGQEQERSEELECVQNALKDAEFDREIYKAQCDDLLHHLHLALPFVEDSENDEYYKSGAVRKAINAIRSSIQRLLPPKTPQEG